MGSRADLFPDAPKTAALLVALAVHGNVAAATLNQTMNAPVMERKFHDIFALVSMGVLPRSPHRSGSAAHLCTAACVYQYVSLALPGIKSNGGCGA
jgi:hypothetical protein